MESVSRIKELLNDKTCIVGMGNYLRKDDAVGLYIVDEVRDSKSAISKNTLNVEDVIESYVFRIADSDYENVLIIDAVSTGDSNTSSGSIIFGELNEYEELINDFSTHKLSLKMCGRILEEHGKKAYLLGIVAADIDFGTGLTSEVRKSADVLKDLIIDVRNCEDKEYVYEH